jgi:voltage-gated potassium channel
MKRYSALFFALFVFLLLQPLVVTLAGTHLPLHLLQIVLFVSAVYAVGPAMGKIMLASALTLGAAGAHLLFAVSHHVSFLLADYLFGFAVTGFVAGAILLEVLRARNITLGIIMGAVCVYLITGACWAFLYFFLQVVSPGSMMAFPIASSGTALPATLEQYRFWEMLYFSMAALSTMGFLSTEPLTSLARQLAVVEAIMGQLYLAVLVARIVALSTAGAMVPGPSLSTPSSERDFSDPLR